MSLQRTTPHTTLVDNFVVTAPSGSAHTDAVTVSRNPWAFALAKGKEATVFNIKATSGTIDVHIVGLR